MAKQKERKYPKEHYRTIKANGFSWFGFLDGLHHFSKQRADGKYAQIRCREEQLENGDFEFMAENGLTL